jgi:Uma2 family endonuclease
MKTLVKIGPADHGRPMSLEEFTRASGREGYYYELIDGRVSVSPHPEPAEVLVEYWLHTKLALYERARPDRIGFISPKATVFVTDRDPVTAPRPDLTVYQDDPAQRPLRGLRWQDISPQLVVEIMTEETAQKDSVRNVPLYLRVPSIMEYWVVDIRKKAETPTLVVYRRDGLRWHEPFTVVYRSTYTTDLLPGFSLTIDPRG